MGRGGGMEGWVGIGGVMNVKYRVVRGELGWVEGGGMVLLVGFMVMSVLVKKGFW